LFEELKKGREQPDATKAAAISIDYIDDYNNDRFNPVICDFVKKLPGVTSKNMYALLNRLNSLSDLLTCSQADLAEILGNSADAEQLYQSLHTSTKPSEMNSAAETKISQRAGDSKLPARRFKSLKPPKK